MKFKYLVTYFLITHCLIFYGQSTKSKKSFRVYDGRMVIEASIFYRKMLNINSYGWNLAVKGYLSKRIITGLTINDSKWYFDKPYLYKTDTILDASLGFISYGWINEYSLIKKDLFRINLTINNALGIASLKNERKRVLGFSSKIGTEPAIVARNIYYIIEPGIDIWIGLSKKQPLYLDLKSKYMLVNGISYFSSSSQFSNFTFGIGLIFLGK